MENRIIVRKRRKAAGTSRALFRYQGGKQSLCEPIVDLFPAGIRRYLEPFIGAGSVFLELRNRGFRGPSFLGDWNLEVVNVYEVVAADAAVFEQAYARHVERHCREHFYSLRDANMSGWTPVERAARTVYLAKAAFHGLLRVNARGRVVSTYGTGELGRIVLDGDRIRSASHAFRGADIRHGDFGWIEHVAEPGDLVFLDPPYVGGNCAYVAEGFSVEDHMRLHRVCQALHAKGAFFMQTNSDRPFVRDLYGSFNFDCDTAAPAIGRGGTGRQPVGEVIIANYKPKANVTDAFEVAA